MNAKHVILAGNPIKGFEVLGPFDTWQEAYEWGEEQSRYPGHLSLGGADWTIAEVRHAEMFAGAAILGES